MAKKNARPTVSVNPVKPTKESIRQAKSARAAKDKRNRIIVVSVLAVLVVALVVTLAILTLKPSEKKTATGSSPVDTANAIVISKDGIGKPVAGLNTLNFFFSYGCPGCIQTDHAMNKIMFDAAKSGKINLALFPVGTHGLPWTYVAGDAALMVSNEQPDKFIDFHTKLIDFAYSVMFKDKASIEAQGNGTILADTAGALNEVKRIAGEVGIKPELIAKFRDVQTASQNIDALTNDWVEGVKSIAGERIGTPMFVKNKDELLDIKRFFEYSKEQVQNLQELQKSNPAEYERQVEQLTNGSYQAVIDYVAGSESSGK